MPNKYREALVVFAADVVVADDDINQSFLTLSAGIVKGAEI